MKYLLGFIGCGNMGGALVTAAAKKVHPDQIAVCDRHEEKLQALETSFGVVRASAEEIAKEAKFVVLGVKPQAMQSTLSPIAQIFRDRDDAILVTMAAGLSISAVRGYAQKPLPVIRIMPNTPVARGAGMVLFTTDGVSADAKTEFLTAFSKAGTFDELPEEKMDAGSALSGCGPAFVYAFAEALADGGVECGLTRTQAELYAAQTLLGAAEMLLAFGHPADLKNAVCSPGGTTIAGMHALENSGFRGGAMSAVLAAYKRTLELKK